VTVCVDETAAEGPLPRLLQTLQRRRRATSEARQIAGTCRPALLRARKRRGAAAAPGCARSRNMQLPDL